MTFHKTKLRVKELAKLLDLDYPEIISTCVLLEIPASSPISSLSLDQCKRIIDSLKSNNIKYRM